MTDVAHATSSDSSRDFTEWVRAREASLLRLALLLTGNRASAEDLVQDTLARMHLSWAKVQSREAVDAYARRVMVNLNLRHDKGMLLGIGSNSCATSFLSR